MTENGRPSPPIPLFLRLDVEALEDLHTGTGTGRGDIDALVQRDRHGRPVIRATHFKGLLREAGEELLALQTASGLDLDVKEQDFKRLLGDAGKGRGALQLTSPRIERGGDVLVWGATQRKEGERAPKPDTLRAVEHVAAGSHFGACLRLGDETLLPLLERLLKRVDRIGGDRNRGSGLVRLDWHPAAPAGSFGAADATGLCWRIVLRNLEPLCLPATGHPGNLIPTHSFIRGQALRGALLGWAIRRGHACDRSLFDRISVGDALPLPENSLAVETVLPIPLSILTEKPSGAGAEPPWWAAGTAHSEEYDSLWDDRQPAEKPKRPGAHEYLCREQGKSAWLRYAPMMRVRLRNATPKRGSRADARLFSLEEIAEETRFQAELRFDDAQAASDFAEVFAPLFAEGDWLGIGRAGQPAVVESIAPAGTVALDQSEAGASGPGDSWSLTLLSDLIARGDQLGFLDNLSLKWLCQTAGLAEQPGWSIERHVAESEVIHGFNAVTGLPRAPAIAIRRGSCWRITGPGSAALARALAAKPALGERVREGCGRFAIDLQPITELGRPEQCKAPAKASRQEQILARAKRLAEQIKPDGPSLSQLQWLREQAEAIQAEAGLAKLLSEIKTAPSRRPQGGKSWAAFPVEGLEDELKELQNMREKRQLIVALVKWRVPVEKERRQ